MTEELNVSCDPVRFKEIGYWTYPNNVELVDWEFTHKSIIFILECNPSELPRIIISFDQLQVVVVPYNELEKAPEMINGKSFNGHHREVLLAFLGLEQRYSCNYLEEFKVFGKFSVS